MADPNNYAFSGPANPQNEAFSTPFESRTITGADGARVVSHVATVPGQTFMQLRLDGERVVFTNMTDDRVIDPGAAARLYSAPAVERVASVEIDENGRGVVKVTYGQMRTGGVESEESHAIAPELAAKIVAAVREAAMPSSVTYGGEVAGERRLTSDEFDQIGGIGDLVAQAFENVEFTSDERARASNDAKGIF